MTSRNACQSIENSQKIPPSKVKSRLKNDLASSETFERPLKKGCFSHFRDDLKGKHGLLFINMSQCGNVLMRVFMNVGL